MTALHLIAAYLLGAISFGVFVLVVLVRVHDKPPGITMNARKPVDVPHRVKRQYRDAEIVATVAPSEPVEEPIYMYGVTAAKRSEKCCPHAHIQDCSREDYYFFEL